MSFFSPSNKDPFDSNNNPPSPNSNLYLGAAYGDSFKSQNDITDELAAMMTSPTHSHPPHDPYGHHSMSSHHHGQDIYRPHPQPHDIFGVGVHPASYPTQFQRPPDAAATMGPFAQFSIPHKDLAQGLPSPADSASFLGRSAAARAANNPSPVSRSRSRSKPARATRGSTAEAFSPRPAHQTHTLPIPISPLNMSLHQPHAQSLPLQPHSASWYHLHGAGPGTPTTPSYLPTPDSYAGTAGGPSYQATPSSLSHTHGMGASVSTSPPSAGTTGVGPRDSPPADTAAKQAALANEKRRRRRESHNAVERRRRDNINEKISELATLIPEVMLDPNTSAPAMGQALFAATGTKPPDQPNGQSPQSQQDLSAPGGGVLLEELDGKDNGTVKANKGMILRKSVEYIRYLQQLVTAQATRNAELESQLTAFRNGNPPPPSAFSVEDDSDALAGLLLASPGTFEFHPSRLPPMREDSGGGESSGLDEEDEAEMRRGRRPRRDVIVKMETDSPMEA